MNPFRQMMHNARGQQAPLGTWLMSASPLVAEAIGCAGFAWAVVDMEHSPLDLKDVVHLLQAVAGTPMLPITRVPWNDLVVIKRVLDAGATTLMVPFVQDVEEARRAVAATRYPPQGIRGMAGMSRGARYGMATDYLRNANQGISVILQLETLTAMAALEQIAAVPGVDALFLGPADLSGSMGHVGDLNHPEVKALLADGVRRAKALGMPVGTVVGTPELVREYRAIGFDFVAIASDLGLLMRAATGAVQALAAAGEGTGDSPGASPLKASGY